MKSPIKPAERAAAAERSAQRRRPSRQGVLNRWGIAAALDARLPQVRGRDRLLHAVRGKALPTALRQPTSIRWGPGLEAVVDPTLDGSLQALYVAQWVRPALVPILEAYLNPGDLFVDVGANVGVYSTWAARIVGPRGHVLALEPVPATRSWLDGICETNGLHHVTTIDCAAGAQAGSARMKTTEAASGLSRVVSADEGDVVVRVSTLDLLLAGQVPQLIKIDVEGHELAVLEGARSTLERTRVPVVFEAPEYGAGDGTIACVDLLASVGYQVFSLTPRGVRPFVRTRYSHNLLAADGTDRTVGDRLRGSRFPRSQNT